MPIQVTRFKCNHCKKVYASVYKAKEHEKQCFFNPEVKSCISCNNQDYKIDVEGCIESTWCQKRQKKIFVKGYPIKHCAGWEPIELHDYSGERI